MVARGVVRTFEGMPSAEGWGIGEGVRCGLRQAAVRTTRTARCLNAQRVVKGTIICKAVPNPTPEAAADHYGNGISYRFHKDGDLKLRVSAGWGRGWRRSRWQRGIKSSPMRGPPVIGTAFQPVPLAYSTVRVAAEGIKDG